MTHGDPLAFGLPPAPATIVIAPDSFKGTLSATDAASALARGWRSVRPHDTCRSVPLADGGEGTSRIVAAQSPGARYMEVTVEDAIGSPTLARWALLPDGTAVVDLASACGIERLRGLRARTASTYGLGQVLLHVASTPAVTKLVIGLGGSASTDCGAGALQALGARLLDGNGVELARGGTALRDLAHLELSAIAPPPPGGVECLVDVTAPLLGPSGAAFQFGPQKGASATEIHSLEAAMHHWASCLGGEPNTSGAGAAGGSAYGLMAGWGARLVPGAQAIAELVGLREAFEGADLVITGEGRFDSQSLGGKVVGHVIELARTRDIPAVVVAGSVLDAPETPGVRVVSLTETAGSTKAAMADPAVWLEGCARDLARASEHGPVRSDRAF
ncbi:glycerate kinase [Pedococcus sp. 5OH_020]|uniref:glycerate kinase n=1 Tax=Pedococcus sp. 5OH_020 TaxID=2989814 RepID=UPI0022EA0E92|nr:glycerate kinase [Pedococcus sp. 5OH_020]